MLTGGRDVDSSIASFLLAQVGMQNLFKNVTFITKYLFYSEKI